MWKRISRRREVSSPGGRVARPPVEYNFVTLVDAAASFSGGRAARPPWRSCLFLRWVSCGPPREKLGRGTRAHIPFRRSHSVCHRHRSSQRVGRQQQQQHQPQSSRGRLCRTSAAEWKFATLACKQLGRLDFKCSFANNECDVDSLRSWYAKSNAMPVS